MTALDEIVSAWTADGLARWGPLPTQPEPAPMREMDDAALERLQRELGQLRVMVETLGEEDEMGAA